MIWSALTFLALLIAISLSFYLVQIWLKKQEREQNGLRQKFDEHQINCLKTIQGSLQHA